MRIKNHLNRLLFPSRSFSLPPFLPTNRFPFSSISLFSMMENSINHFQYVYIKLLIWVNGDAGDVCWPPGLGWNNIYFSLRENALSSSKKVVANFNRFSNEQKMREIFEIEARKRSPQHTHRHLTTCKITRKILWTHKEGVEYRTHRICCFCCFSRQIFCSVL